MNAPGGAADERVPWPWLRPLLVPLSWLYSLGLRLFLLPYRMGLRKRHHVECPVVCVGNLTFGGTGKTPAVIAIARELTRRGLNIVVLSRGYGGRLSGAGAVVSDGTGRKLSYEDCGDEPALIADALPGIPVVVGKNRVRMGRKAASEFNPHLILMDDGMQYWQLHKDVIIALVKAGNPFGVGGVLPAGTLREPKSGLRRASAVVMTGVDRLADDERGRVSEVVAAASGGARVYTACHSPEKLYKLTGMQELPLETLKGQRVAAVSSIGSPASFEDTLVSLGAVVEDRLRFPDHHTFRENDLEMVREKSLASLVVTTEKDAVRLRSGCRGEILVLGVRLQIEHIEGLADLICRKSGYGVFVHSEEEASEPGG